MTARDCDIAIVGGGLVGASLACALAPLGYAVEVVEAVPAQAAAQPSYDDRTLALGLASCRILHGLGLWPALAAAATPIREIIVSEPGRPGRVRLEAAEMGLDAFGQVVEARAFGVAASARLAQLPGVRVHCPARVSGWRDGGDVAELDLQVADGATRTLRAALVVAADGADSALRALAGIAVREKDYGQVAVVANLTPREPHGNRAWERLTASGPFAVLPHQGERCGLVWCVPTGQSQGLLDLPEAEFLARAGRRFNGDPAFFRRLGRRQAYALKQVVPATDRFPRGLLVGNAAHAIHPVAAQGFNLGLRDVAVLAELLAAPAAHGDPGGGTLLAAYSDWRRPDIQATTRWTDELVGAFASPLGIAAGLRSLGLAAHALLPPLRRRLACRAMGYRGRIPRLALGESLAPLP